MNFNPISISGYHMREAGATAVQEVGFTLANALEYVASGRGRRARVDEFGPRLSFFFAAHNDLFEEVAKFRAARRLWARLVRERFGADDADLPAPLPHPDRRRHAAGAAAAQQRGAGHRAGARRGAGRHPVAAHQRLRRGAGASDRGVGDPRAAHPADPRLSRAGVDRVGRSRWPAASTSRRSPTGSRPRRRALIEEVDALGGAAAAIERGYFQEAIARSAWELQQAQESGRQVVVGVNRFTDDSPAPTMPAT